MRDIVTVTGNLACDKIGFCQFHEHLLLSKGRSFEINPALYMDDIEAGCEEAKRFLAAGGNTIIDAQPGMIYPYLEDYTGDRVCSKQLYEEDVYKRQCRM